jgi:hypothetical protein
MSDFFRNLLYLVGAIPLRTAPARYQFIYGAIALAMLLGLTLLILVVGIPKWMILPALVAMGAVVLLIRFAFSRVQRH